MPQDIFGRASGNFGGAFAADQAAISLGGACQGAGDMAVLGQNLEFTYTQNVVRLYELHACQKYYYVGGRTDGRATVRRVLGPAALSAAFYACIGDMCCAGSNNLTICMNTGCDSPNCTGEIPGEDVQYTLAFCVLTSIRGSVAAENMIISEDLGILFSRLEYKDTGVDCGGCQEGSIFTDL